MKSVRTLVSALITALTLAASAAPKPKVEGLIWRATSGDTAIYLVGSVHLGTPDMYPLPPVYDEAYKAAKALVVEVNINKVDQAQVFTQVQQLGMYANDDTLEKHIDAATWKQAQKICGGLGLPDAAIDKMKPWLLATTISVLQMQKAGMQAGLGVDEHFLNLATKDGKPIQEAESMEFQMGLLAGFPDKVQLDYLKTTLEDKTDPAKFSQEVVADWIAGDTAGVGKLMLASGGPPEVEKKLLDDRNPHMADVAEGFLKDHKPCLFIVGAGHLLGDKGVVSLLKQRGYKVEQVLN